MHTWELPHGAKRWAILVEAGYVPEHSPFHEDVIRVKDWLQGNHFRVPSENIQCFNSPGLGTGTTLSTMANIKKALEERRDLATGDRKFDLVFFYFLGHGSKGGGVYDCNNRIIAPTVLTNIFDEMAIQGLILTVVINACFSGNLQRPETAMANSYPGMGGLPKYNLLAACSPYQSAGMGNDNEVGDEDRYGARLTYYMLKALTENPRCTLEMIRRRAFAAGRLTSSGELPMVWEKDNTNCSFFDKVSNTVLPSISARWVGLNTVELAAGAAHGVLPGSVYTLYPWDSVTNRIHWHSHIPMVPPDALVNPATRTRILVTQISPLTSTATVNFGGNRDAFYANAPTTWACQAVLFSPDIVVPVTDVAARWVEYHRVLGLTNIIPATELPNIFSFGVFHEEKLYDVFNTTKGKHHNLRFRMNRNLQHRFVLLTVLQFTANGDVHKYFPRLADYEVVRPDTDCVFEISRNMHSARSDRETSTFKAFITTVPTPFDIVEGLSSRGKITGSRSTEFGVTHEFPEPPIPAGVTAHAWGQFRDAYVSEEVIMNPPEMWCTMSVTIHTTKNS